MKKTLFFALVLLTLSITSYSQEPDLSKIKNPKEKAKAWTDYCEELRSNGQYPALKEAALKGLKIVQQNDTLNNSLLFFYAAFGYYYQRSFDSAQYYFYQSLNKAQQAKSDKLIANACVALISINFQLQQPAKADSCKDLLQRILDTTKNTEVLQDGYTGLGNYYQQKSFYSTAQNYFIKSLNLRKKDIDTTHDQKKKLDYAIQCYTLFKLYNNMGLMDKSLEMLNNGRRFMDLSPVIHIRYLSPFTEAFSTSGNIDSALYYMRQLQALTKNSPTISSEIVSVNLNVAQYYIEHKQYNKALPYVKVADSLATISKSPLLLYQSQMISGRYFQETGKYAEAIDALSKSIPVARQISKEQYVDDLKFMALAQKGAGNYTKALDYYQQYGEQLDTLTKEKISRNFADMQTRYETTEKENRIVSLNQENKLNTLELKQDSNTRTILILGLISLGIFSLLLYFIYRNKEKLNKILNQRNTQLDELNNQLSVANETKAKLFGVISHDLRTPVSKIVNLLHLQKENSQNANEQVRNQYVERINKASENVLETMEDLLLWSKSQMQKFVPQFKEVKILPLITQEMALFDEQINEKELQINTKIDHEIFQNTDENFLAVILRNLIQNSINQCNNKAAIIIQANANTISITNPASNINIDDLNSVMQQTQVSNAQSGLGLQIVKDLATRIGVKIFYEHQEENSVSAVLSWV